MGSPAPAREDWLRLWRLWDAATLSMIPPGCHHDRPLGDLRQPLIFYLGHLPAFTDARLAKVLAQPLSHPAHFAEMFARGIDPDLDDPTKCHSHSPTPAEWPAVDDILAYRDRVRGPLLQLYPQHSPNSSSISSEGGGTASDTTNNSISSQLDVPQHAAKPAMSAELEHVLWMSYEHEAMHLETLLYMLVQYKAVLPPPAALVPSTPAAAWCSFLACRHAVREATSSSGGSGNAHNSSISNDSDSPAAADSGTIARLGRLSSLLLPQPREAAWLSVPPGVVVLGFTPQQHTSSNTASNGSSSSGDAPPPAMGFGWDNESPARLVEVAAGVEMQHRPVTVLEYLRFVAGMLAAHSLAASAEKHKGERQEVPPLAAPVASCVGMPATDSLASRTAGVCNANSNNSNTSSQCSSLSGYSSSGGTATTLPEVLAAVQDSSSSVSCAACSKRLIQLLHVKQGCHLLPASLTVLPAQRQPTAAAAGSDERCCECAGLCKVMQTASCDGSVSSGGSEGSSTCEAPAGPASDVRLSQAQLQAALLAALQLHVAVKSVFGPVPVCIAGLWPVYCSALQAEQYAAWFSTESGSTCRLPTEAEVVACAAVTPAGGESTGAAVRSVDFAVWHPVCVPLAPAHTTTSSTTANGAASSSSSSSSGPEGVQRSDAAVSSSGAAAEPRGAAAVAQLRDNGWEWTCTTFGSHVGFTPHTLYPEYSQDFFGGKHVVLVGGSWATVGSIAERLTFRNWYQKGQEHVFAKFRLCRSVEQDG